MSVPPLELPVGVADATGPDQHLAESLSRDIQRGWLHSFLSSRFAVATAWGVTLGLLLVVALRFACHDAWDVLLWFNAFTVYVYLPAYVIGAIAISQHRWWLAAVNSALIAFHLACVVPDFRPARLYPSKDAPAAVSQTLRIFSANINATNPDRGSVLREIAEVKPDIVVLIEYRRWWTQSLRDSPVLKPYVYGTNLDKPYDGEVAIFSRLPISKQQMLWTTGPRVNDVVDIPLGKTSLRLFALHSPRPFYEAPHNYGGFWRQAIPLISQQPRPLVVIGDFNATQFSRVYQDLTALGLRSAHEDRGRGYATTWPNGEDPLPPVRIDQAMLSPEVECLSIAEGIGKGSDHKPLILEVRVHTADSVAAATAGGR
jgi:endonuclease/exonuclease/phosphatase (EEP) superfamily protein YafD